MANLVDMPLFPLGTVLFSGSKLPLRIFEPRYLGLVSECMRAEAPFGVVLIREGHEVRLPDQDAPTIFHIGTAAHIVDFDPLPNGRLGIVCEGRERFRIHRSWVRDDDVMAARVEYLPEERPSTVGPDFSGLVDVLSDLMQHPLVRKLGLEVDYDDARSVSWRLADLLPIDVETRQNLLQMRQAHDRLEVLDRMVREMSSEE